MSSISGNYTPKPLKSQWNQYKNTGFERTDNKDGSTTWTGTLSDGTKAESTLSSDGNYTQNLTYSNGAQATVTTNIGNNRKAARQEKRIAQKEAKQLRKGGGNESTVSNTEAERKARQAKAGFDTVNNSVFNTIQRSPRNGGGFNFGFLTNNRKVHYKGNDNLINIPINGNNKTKASKTLDSILQDYSGTTDLNASEYGNATEKITIFNSEIETAKKDKTKVKQLKDDLSVYKNEISEKLGKAKADKGVLQNQKTTAQSKIKDLKTKKEHSAKNLQQKRSDFENSKSKLNSSRKTRDQMDKQLGTLNSNYSKSCTAVTNAEKNKSAKQQKLSGLKQSHGKAKASVNNATQQFNASQAALSKIPQTLENGAPNPDYQSALTAYNEAKQAKGQAENNLKQTEQEISQAEEELTNAENELQIAQQQKEEINKNIQQTQTSIATIAQNCQKLEQQVQTNEKEVDNLGKEVDQLENSEQQITEELQYQNGIETQLNNFDAEISNLEKAQGKVDEMIQETDNIEQMPSQDDLNLNFNQNDGDWAIESNFMHQGMDKYKNWS